MSEQGLPEDIPQAVVDTRRRVSLVWLIPLVAALAAVWLAYRAETEQGPLVTIRFASAEGLEAGKTRVRHKDVEIGQVEAVELNQDLSSVLVKARIDPGIEPYLTEGSRFWVVRPRVSGREITGLGTLVGGAYIGADLTGDAAPTLHFEGLEEPPVIDSATPGTTFELVAESLGSVQAGTPVYYRGIEVGQVTGYRLPESDGPIELQAFVRAPHDARVRTGTRFWQSAGIDLEFGAEGFQVRSESLATLLLGGVSFGKLHEGDDVPADPGHRFVLYASRGDAAEQRFTRTESWTLEFDGSVRGLQPGAPVEFRGIKVGEVTDLTLELDVEALSARIPVRIELAPERLRLTGTGAEGLDPEARRAFWDELVRRGLRAQLKTGSLLTGALYVDLDVYPGAAPAGIDWTDAHPRLPTVPTALDELRDLLLKLARLPVEDIARDLRASLEGINQTLARTGALLDNLDQQVAPELTRTLQQSQQTLVGIEKTIAPGSALHNDTQLLLRELTAAARSIRLMADYLERHPEALLRGKGGTPR